jgi:hypothetical protein
VTSPSDEETDHAKLQLARLQPAMRTAAEAVADGHFSAINQVYDDEARKKLMDKLNRAAANLGYDQIIAASKAAAEASQSQGSGETAGPEEAKEKTPWGVGASL